MQKLGLPTADAILTNLSSTYVDKVLHDVGLVVSLYDVLDIGEGKVHHGEGGVYYSVVFRVVVFRPLPSELLLGQITHMNEYVVSCSFLCLVA